MTCNYGDDMLLWWWHVTMVMTSAANTKDGGNVHAA